MSSNRKPAQAPRKDNKPGGSQVRLKPEHATEDSSHLGGSGAKKVIKHEEPLQLTEEERNAEVDRIIEATNPNAPENIVRFSNEDRVYKFTPSVEQAAFHYVDDG